MVDTEPVANNHEICKSIASIDERSIWAVAITESGTIIGYYYNNKESDSLIEAGHDFSTRVQNLIRSTGGKLASISSTGQDLTGKMRHIVAHNDLWDILVFPMPYTGSPQRILIVLSKASAKDYRSPLDIIQGRLDQMRA